MIGMPSTKFTVCVKVTFDPISTKKHIKTALTTSKKFHIQQHSLRFARKKI